MYLKNKNRSKYLFYISGSLLLLCSIAAAILFYVKKQQTIPILRLSETEAAFSEAGLTGSSLSFTDEEVAQNPYAELSVPTQITKVDDTYFIVDCYHDQIIYSDSLTAPLSEWNVMTDQIDKGHTLASDGTVYLADDTENNRILIFEKAGKRFVHTQTFSNIGIRPHYIVYHEADGCFYAWSSMTGEMYIFRRAEASSRVFLSEIRSIPALNGVYVRSFSMIGRDVYFVSGNSSIIRADRKTFAVREEYPVPDAIAGMIQLTLIDGFYYITVSTDKAGDQAAATILRTKDLHSLSSSDYEDIYSCFIGGGTPYYISAFDGSYYLTEHRLAGHSIWRFQTQSGYPADVTALY